VNDDALIRIAAALERISPPLPEAADLTAHPAYHWDGKSPRQVQKFAPLPLALITGVERQKHALLENIRRHASGNAAHDVLLWGARGMGKSALVKSAASAMQDEKLPLALLEAAASHIDSLPDLFALLAEQPRRFILFIDDIGFDGSSAEARLLRSMLEGGAEARPDNLRLIITSNRRNILERRHAVEEDAINTRDEQDDSLALADRFGLKLGFQYPDQADWLAMVAAYAEHFNLEWNKEDALAFAHARGGRSGRIAWHYTVELAGRANKTI